MRVLVVEDEAEFAALLVAGLSHHGVLADAIVEGEQAVQMAHTHAYDVICLDVNLPGIDGFETCRRLRAAEVLAPVLMLTARDAIDDRIAGLDTGADDYLVKPFVLGELLARLRALARRPPPTTAVELRVGDLVLDPRTHRVRRGATEVPLTTKELHVLEVFMRHPGAVLSRFDILERAWDAAFESHSNVVDVYVRALRAKLDRPFGRETLETVRGAGYRLRVDEG
ncbi:MAG: response regulator transcription factor [Solirubrobacteraceae bacterium]|nr:response regulator transcription factor [Patulibacter sp.]